QLFVQPFDFVQRARMRDRDGGVVGKRAQPRKCVAVAGTSAEHSEHSKDLVTKSSGNETVRIARAVRTRPSISDVSAGARALADVGGHAAVAACGDNSRGSLATQVVPCRDDAECEELGSSLADRVDEVKEPAEGY